MIWEIAVAAEATRKHFGKSWERRQVSVVMGRETASNVEQLEVERSSNENHPLLGPCKRGAVGCSWLFRHRMHSATVARLDWPARLPRLAGTVTAEITQKINSPTTGASGKAAALNSASSLRLPWI
jgi:hypothetical protein